MITTRFQQSIKRVYGKIAQNAAKYGRLPAGHTEGWLEAMGNLYDNFTDCLIATKYGKLTKEMVDYPTIEAGVAGLKFVEACLESNDNVNIFI